MLRVDSVASTHSVRDVFALFIGPRNVSPPRFSVFYFTSLFDSSECNSFFGPKFAADRYGIIIPSSSPEAAGRHRRDATNSLAVRVSSPREHG